MHLSSAFLLNEMRTEKFNLRRAKIGRNFPAIAAGNLGKCRHSSLLSSTTWRIRRSVPLVSATRRLSAASREGSGLESCFCASIFAGSGLAKRVLFQNLNVIVFSTECGFQGCRRSLRSAPAHAPGRGVRGAATLRFGAGSRPSRCACLRASLRERRMASAFCRTRFYEGFS
jgi:hypothetical protein